MVHTHAYHTSCPHNSPFYDSVRPPTHGCTISWLQITKHTRTLSHAEKLIKWVSAHSGHAKHANEYKFSSGAWTRMLLFDFHVDENVHIEYEIALQSRCCSMALTFDVHWMRMRRKCRCSRNDKCVFDAKCKIDTSNPHYCCCKVTWFNIVNFAFRSNLNVVYGHRWVIV